jgi:ferredoxin
MGMRVWIDQELCTGDGLCEETCATAFEMGVDGLAYVKEDAGFFGASKVFDEGGASGQARVPEAWEEAAIEAAESCPGECIFVEVD